ncbi:MAG: hypothetical protein E6G34_10205 [Actinobacteria bacterium]|nr:MAG: hypothetical protein E6G34_10205 [Actinomycetota bacterium]
MMHSQDNPPAEGCLGCGCKTTTALGLVGRLGFLIATAKHLSEQLSINDASKLFSEPEDERAPVQVLLLCHVCAAKVGVQVAEFWGELSDIPIYYESENFPEGNPIFEVLERLHREGWLGEFVEAWRGTAFIENAELVVELPEYAEALGVPTGQLLAVREQGSMIVALYSLTPDAGLEDLWSAMLERDGDGILRVAAKRELCPSALIGPDGGA